MPSSPNGLDGPDTVVRRLSSYLAAATITRRRNGAIRRSDDPILVRQRCSADPRRRWELVRRALGQAAAWPGGYLGRTANRHGGVAGQPPRSFDRIAHSAAYGRARLSQDR